MLIHLRRDEMALYRGQDRLALLQAEAQRRCGMPGWEALARADLVPLRRAVRPGQLQHDPPPHRAPAPQPPAAGIAPPRFWTVSDRAGQTPSQGGTLVLYDVSSSYLEGRCCPLAQFGYSRDGKRGKRQIVYGLLCAPDGCPVAIEVFAGSTADPTTLTGQVTKLKQRFGLDHVVLVGDRGMITQARITEDIKPAGLDWITALRAPAIKALLDGGALQMSLFDDRDMAGITSPEFPGERLIVCRNRALAAERARKREDLLAATERDLARIAAAVARKRQPLRGKAEIGLEIGAVLDKHKMAKHFALDITDTRFSFARKTDEITAEAALDGLYVVRTSLPAAALDDTATVRSYKSLSLVERAFRCIKTVDLQIRPVYHWLADRVRAHVFLCMLAYYLEWHMRQRQSNQGREQLPKVRVGLITPERLRRGGSAARARHRRSAPAGGSRRRR